MILRISYEANKGQQDTYLASEIQVNEYQIWKVDLLINHRPILHKSISTSQKSKSQGSL